VAAVWTRDEIIMACALVSENEWRGVRASEPAVKQLSELLRRAPIHPESEKTVAFRSPDSVQRKTFDIATQHPDYRGKPTKGNKLDRVVLRDFLDDPERMLAVAQAIRSAIDSGTVAEATVAEVEASDMVAPEGALLLARHVVRERDPRLRREKLKDVASRGLRPCCEICSFDFGRIYGALGEGYIEVHHRLPLHSSGPTLTKLADLALVCANCHRMIHRSKAWLTPEQLTELMTNRFDT
jgi:5-methylcytosine-specific restriction protein A